MAVYLITLHAYRSWGPDKPRGFVRKGRGILPPDSKLARIYDAQAKDEPVVYTAEMQRVLIAGAHDICSRRGWRLHAVGNDATHTHLLISQRGFMDWEAVRDKLKNVLSLFLGLAMDQPGKPWFASKGSRKQVKDRDHFRYLVQTYLPRHRGLFWKEDDRLPDVTQGILAAEAGRPGSCSREGIE